MRRSLFIRVIALVLCLTMLVGDPVTAIGLRDPLIQKPSGMELHSNALLNESAFALIPVWMRTAQLKPAYTERLAAATSAGIRNAKQEGLPRRRGGSKLLSALASAWVAFSLGCGSVITTPTAVTAPSPSPTPWRPPKIVLVVFDDARLDDFNHMPHIQQEIVQQGATFTNAYAGATLCTPSRASILLGQYEHNHRIFDNEPPKGVISDL